MFFFLSKILAFLLTPLVWVFTLFIWSWRTKIETRSKKLFWAGLIVLYIFSNGFIANLCMRMWEYTYDKEDWAPEKDRKFDCAIILGGMLWYNEKLEKPQFMRSSDRLFQTLWLLKTKKIDRIIFTGGSGSIDHPDHKEALILKRWLKQMDFPDSCLVYETESKNTHENAVFTKRILDSLKIDPKNTLLVTSAFHMRRGMACFEKAGVHNLNPYITDCYSGPPKFEIDHCFIPSADAMQVYNLLIHEVTGYITYKLIGYC